MLEEGAFCLSQLYTAKYSTHTRSQRFNKIYINKAFKSLKPKFFVGSTQDALYDGFHLKKD